ncbi:hypothetical protein [Pontibacter pamirensis]|uniref:hypothetical protein n=1 Tax=Pontibacter pamirensis TaxID=2562824 RepID=UPI00138976F9|nr:hypothetical protein [Pontibacter pamirensis]
MDRIEASGTLAERHRLTEGQRLQLETDIAGLISRGKATWAEMGKPNALVEMTGSQRLKGRYFNFLAWYDPLTNSLDINEFIELSLNEYLDFLIESNAEADWVNF